MKHLKFILISFVAIFAACSPDPGIVSVGIDDSYTIYRMQKLHLNPALTGEAYRWTLINGSDTEKTLSEERDYIFIAEKEGIYNLSFEIIDAETPYKMDFAVNVLHEEIEYSPYISRVYEYCPAPGQFVNDMPEYEDGDTYNDMLKKAEEAISGTAEVLISLGSYGGYVTFGFDHTIVNVEGEKDFRIWGNMFYDTGNQSQKGGSAEPGIVMVSFDRNCNGQPDDEWYELAGSEYDKSLKNYEITYHRPDPDREIIKDNVWGLTDVNYIRWSDSEGKEGYVSKNTFHVQDYFPKWLNDETLSFRGTCLPQNAELNGRMFFFNCFGWGYADTYPNGEVDNNSFDIDWAVDIDGNRIKLPGADFVRVYTGVNQYCGWLGETSTEICKAADLHVYTE